MQINYLFAAIPMFVGFMLIEYFYAKSKGWKYFNMHNSLTNISIGIAERLADVFIAGAFFFVYDYIQKEHGLFSIKASIGVWIILFLLTDFVWYWYHRLAHEINVLWLAHVVHHQSEDFNYTVSARITVLQAIARTCFWCVLPFIGFPAPMITSLLLVHGLYPFFIHTRTIGKLGFLEYILVTPSHHRVHHASNEKYLDRNYGDVLIIWDKLFGTFAKEDEKEVIKFGLTHPLQTHSFLRQHLHFAVELWLAMKSKRGLLNKLRVLIAKPETLEPTLRHRAEEIFHIRRNPKAITQPLNKYVIVQFLFLLVGLTLFIAFEHQVPLSSKVCWGLIVILTLINCGAIMEQKKWVFEVELIRLSAFLLLAFEYSAFISVNFFLTFLLSIVVLLQFQRLREYYLKLIYRTNERSESSA
ncbi:MAG: sterol desaturase family protein [Chitinophagaceae bacterium]|nr:sterol desaturase family protein [Chitinophagaceae bacterium]